MAKTSDVIVVGAGIAGSSLAFHLASHGVGVTLLEKRFPAAGPSGRSSALLHLFYVEPELSQLAARGIDILRRMPELTGHPSDFREVGMLWVGGASAAAGYSAAAARIRDEEGGDISLLSLSDFEEIAPGFTPDEIAVAIYEPHSGYADPASATTALAKRAGELGATLRMNTRMKRIVLDGGRAVGIETEKGERLLADRVVLATGPWTRPHLQDINIDLPLFVERHVIAVLDAPGKARELVPFCWCDDVFMNYGRPEGENLLLFGTWAGGGTGTRNSNAPDAGTVRDPDKYKEDASAEESSDILQYVTPRIPGMANLGVRRGYAGLYDMSPDDLPVIGPVPGVDNLYVIAGSSGHGFKLGPGVGEAVAQLIETGESPLLSPFSPERFLTHTST
jgi:sarcosine oxidase, subunit beta